MRAGKGGKGGKGKGGGDEDADFPKCGADTCTQHVWAADANGHPCGDRINWVVANEHVDEEDACRLVAVDEYPAECGGCAPPEDDPCDDDDHGKGGKGKGGGSDGDEDSDEHAGKGGKGKGGSNPCVCKDTWTSHETEGDCDQPQHGCTEDCTHGGYAPWCIIKHRGCDEEESYPRPSGNPSRPALRYSSIERRP